MSPMTKAVDAACIKVAIVTGLTIGGTNLVTGMAAEDTIIEATFWASDVPANDAANCTLVSGGFTSATNLSGEILKVLWLDRTIT